MPKKITSENRQKIIAGEKMPVYYTANKGKIYERWECPFCEKIISIVSPCFRSAVFPHIEDYAQKHCEVHYGDVEKWELLDVLHDLYNNRIEDTETTMDEWITECVLFRLQAPRNVDVKI